MTKHECAVVTAYTDVSMLKGADLKYLYDYLSGFIGRPVYTHEIPAVALAYRDKIREDFLELSRNAKDEPVARCKGCVYWSVIGKCHNSESECCGKETNADYACSMFRPDNADADAKCECVAKLVRESTRKKSEKYICTTCKKACYYPHSRNSIPYKFCPNCGKEVQT